MHYMHKKVSLAVDYAVYEWCTRRIQPVQRWHCDDDRTPA